MNHLKLGSDTTTEEEDCFDGFIMTLAQLMCINMIAIFQMMNRVEIAWQLIELPKKKEF